MQEPCDGTNIQIWILQSVGGDLWHIVNDRTNTCLDARGGATNGTPVEEFTCDSISNENWSLNTNTPIVTTITSHVSGTSRDCLDNPERSKMPDTSMQIFACNKTVAQQWFVG